jgi:hypothetical protein
VNAELVQLLQAACVLSTSRADVGTLEAAIDVLEAEAIVCDLHEQGGCGGPVYSRTCADCGHRIARCDAHGGNKSASRCMWLHRRDCHGGHS